MHLGTCFFAEETLISLKLFHEGKGTMTMNKVRARYPWQICIPGPTLPENHSGIGGKNAGRADYPLQIFVLAFSCSLSKFNLG